MSVHDDILGANDAYYRAFQTGDYAGMSALWAEDGVSCVHPGWPVLIGRQAILESYRGILGNPDRERIAHHSDTPMVSGMDGRVFCIEIVGGMALAVTNWFRRVDGAWRLIHHQASLIAQMAGDEIPSPDRLN